jgi:plasmid stabilization system protein ParE
MLPIDYLPGARQDFDESFDWYLERSVQTALRFTAAVDAAVINAGNDPERFAPIGKTHRACPVKRFPFRIVFRVVEGRMIVVAVAHAKRRPGYWRNR